MIERQNPGRLFEIKAFRAGRRKAIQRAARLDREACRECADVVVRPRAISDVGFFCGHAMENCYEGVSRRSSDVDEIEKQFQVELALLVNIEKSLRIVLDWMTGDLGIVRKRSTIRLVAQSFDRHWARLRVLSEHGGYMHLVTDSMPNLANEVSVLKGVRDRLQAELEPLIIALEHLSPGDKSEFEQICVDVERYLEALSAHDQQERGLFHCSIDGEEGGSG